MSPPDFPRRVTIPPTPPPTDLPSRVWVLERDFGDIKESIAGIDLKIDDIKNTLTVITTQRDGESKTREHVLKVITGIAVGVAVAALGTLSAWVIHIQTAMAAAGK